MSEELVTIQLSRRRAAALGRVIDLQLACEESGMLGPLDPHQSAAERDETMHGVRHPIQDGDGVLYPIACRRNVLAQQRGEELGGCRWVADEGIPGGVACTTCGKAECPGMARASELRSMVDGTYMPRTSTHFPGGMKTLRISRGGGDTATLTAPPDDRQALTVTPGGLWTSMLTTTYDEE